MVGKARIVAPLTLPMGWIAGIVATWTRSPPSPRPGEPSMKVILAVGLSLLVIATAHAENAGETTRYVALVNGGTTKAGHEWVKRGGDGTTSVDFLFKDNGRGPELKEEFKVDKDGTFTEYRVKGQSTFGAVIDETFTRNGDKATWKSTSDHGEQVVVG